MIEVQSLHYWIYNPLPEYPYKYRPVHALDLPERGGLGDADMDVSGQMMFKGAGGAVESAAGGLGSTESSPQKPSSGVKTVSRVRQEFPEAWLWTETHTKYFKIKKIK